MTTKITEINAETGEVVVRDATSDELAQFVADKTMIDDAINESNALKAKKQEVLAKLGLTDDEVSALLA